MREWLERALAWARAHEKGVLLGAAGLQLLVLVAMIAPKAVARAQGETMVVRVVPIDPRDLFRGEYVILGYEFSRPSLNFANRTLLPGQTVYVTLRHESGEEWKADRFSLELPRGERFLKGTVNGGGMIDYGIESFFVQEGRGREYENAARRGTLYAELSVTPDGKGMLKGLRIGR